MPNTSDRTDAARKGYLEFVGYDPFKDDPTITLEEVETALSEIIELHREAGLLGANQ